MRGGGREEQKRRGYRNVKERIREKKRGKVRRRDK